MAMPRTIAQEDISLRTAADPQEDVLGGVSMFFERDGRHVPVAEQSDGLRQLMSMTLFDLAEGAANVVAVDEPELHLHPASQRTVAELFRSGGNQKILVTHSPYIVQPFEPSQVIAVSPDGTCHQIPAGKLTAVEKERASWWSPRLLEVLAACYAIVVEGVSDRIIVEAAARVMGIGLDRRRRGRVRHRRRPQVPARAQAHRQGRLLRPDPRPRRRGGEVRMARRHRRQAQGGVRDDAVGVGS